MMNNVYNSSSPVQIHLRARNGVQICRAPKNAKREKQTENNTVVVVGTGRYHRRECCLLLAMCVRLSHCYCLSEVKDCIFVVE